MNKRQKQIVYGISLGLALFAAVLLSVRAGTSDPDSGEWVSATANRPPAETGQTTPDSNTDTIRDPDQSDVEGAAPPNIAGIENPPPVVNSPADDPQELQSQIRSLPAIPAPTVAIDAQPLNRSGFYNDFPPTSTTDDPGEGFAVGQILPPEFQAVPRIDEGQPAGDPQFKNRSQVVQAGSTDGTQSENRIAGFQSDVFVDEFPGQIPQFDSPEQLESVVSQPRVPNQVLQPAEIRGGAFQLEPEPGRAIPTSPIPENVVQRDPSMPSLQTDSPTVSDSASDRQDSVFRQASAPLTQPAFEPAAAGPLASSPPPVPPVTAATPEPAAAKQPVAPAPGGGPTAALNARDFRMAAQPQIGDHYKDDTPQTDNRAWLSEYNEGNFSDTPIQPYLPYDAYGQIDVYQGKTLNATQRPLLELGRPWYQLGQLPEPKTTFGAHNPVHPQFLVFGDYRRAFASNDNKGDDLTQIAWQLNLFANLHLTSTERIVTSINPLGKGGNNTRFEFDNGGDLADEFDLDLDFGYLEGDLGAIAGGFTGETLPFDLPFAIGVAPLLAQNGVWLEDAFLGFALTVPARNSPALDISNMDLTFFAGYDEINSDAFPGSDDRARIFGFLSFIEALNGYFEIDYAYLEDRDVQDLTYHNFSFAYTRRYGRFISNSTRIIVNGGQNPAFGAQTADGILLLSENSLITGAPSSIIPYLNFFAGFDRPQSAARAAAAGGVLRNTGILFESDNLTGFPTLDATARDTYGAALGVNILPDDWSQQLVLEAAALGTIGDAEDRFAQGSQFGLGYRYQLPLTNSVILRSDAMYGFLGNENDIHGFRMELRRKF